MYTPTCGLWTGQRRMIGPTVNVLVHNILDVLTQELLSLNLRLCGENENQERGNYHENQNSCW